MLFSDVTFIFLPPDPLINILRQLLLLIFSWDCFSHSLLRPSGDNEEIFASRHSNLDSKTLIKFTLCSLVVCLWFMFLMPHLISFPMHCNPPLENGLLGTGHFDTMKRTHLTQIAYVKKVSPTIGGLTRLMMGRVKWRHLCWYLYIIDDQPVWWDEWIIHDQVKAASCRKNLFIRFSLNVERKGPWSLRIDFSPLTSRQ